VSDKTGMQLIVADGDAVSILKMIRISLTAELMNCCERGHTFRQETASSNNLLVEMAVGRSGFTMEICSICENIGKGSMGKGVLICKLMGPTVLNKLLTCNFLMSILNVGHKPPPQTKLPDFAGPGQNSSRTHPDLWRFVMTMYVVLTQSLLSLISNIMIDYY
jgi:hypothetical protein